MVNWLSIVFSGAVSSQLRDGPFDLAEEGIPFQPNSYRRLKDVFVFGSHN